jgi:Holliday junction resolvase RusA-like endonuclease
MGLKKSEFKKLLKRLGESPEKYGFPRKQPETDHARAFVEKLTLILPGGLAVPKKRPRLGQGGRVYSPTGPEEEKFADVLKFAMLEACGEPVCFRCFVEVRAEFYFLENPRGDLDNYEKFLYDALEKSGIIENDRLIRANVNKIRLCESIEEEKIVLEVIPYELGKWRLR